MTRYPKLLFNYNLLRREYNCGMKTYYVYILTSKYNGTLYVGVTNDLERRVYEHKNKIVEGFTKQYNVNILVYYEETEDIVSAITREKVLKKFSRQKKINLIESMNEDWRDLSLEF
jgi:putative endonuclease